VHYPVYYPYATVRENMLMAHTRDDLSRAPAGLFDRCDALKAVVSQ